MRTFLIIYFSYFLHIMHSLFLTNITMDVCFYLVFNFINYVYIFEFETHVPDVIYFSHNEKYIPYTCIYIDYDCGNELKNKMMIAVFFCYWANFLEENTINVLPSCTISYLLCGIIIFNISSGCRNNQSTDGSWYYRLSFIQNQRYVILHGK